MDSGLFRYDFDILSMLQRDFLLKLKAIKIKVVT